VVGGRGVVANICSILGDFDGNPSTETDPLVLLLDAVRAFVDRPAVACTQAELGERLIQLRHGIDLLELGFAVQAAAFAATDEFEVQGSVSPVDWVRHHCRISGHAAARALTTGEQAPQLPAAVAALEAGQIGSAHLSLLAATARAIGTGPSGTPFDERPLLSLALEHSVSRFGFDCTHARHVADAAAVLADHLSGVEARRLELIRCEGGGLALRGCFDPVAAAAIRTALEPLARPTGYGDTRSREQRNGDALVELVTHCLDAGVIPATSGQRTHLQLTASVETVQGLSGAPGGELEFAGVVPAATVQRLACDASIRRILLGPDSAVIDVGRALRLPAGPTRAALRVRDQGCVWPGCERPVTWCNAHHVLHWSHGGVTELPNLVLLCYRHHWMVHEGGWQLLRYDHQQVLAISPFHPHRSWTRAPTPP
jgi:hypothetical protein